MNKKTKPLRPLTKRQEHFCVEYAKSTDATQAYRAAYTAGKMNPQSLWRRAYEVMQVPQVKARIADLREKAQKINNFTVADVLKKWVMIATANPNELIQNRRTCCRYCHGLQHEKQWVEMEYAMACAKAIQDCKDPPVASGGFGFDATRDPHPCCPMCFGEGVEGVYVADTRKLSESAAALYAGLKKTRNGVEVLMRDQDAALANIAKFLGMFKTQVEINDPNGVLSPAIRNVTTDPIEAAKIYQRFITES